MKVLIQMMILQENLIQKIMNNTEPKKRTSRYVRPPKDKRMKGRFQQDSDGLILMLAHEYRYMTRPMLETILNRKNTPMKNRLRFLWHWEYLDKVENPNNFQEKGSKPDIYILGKEGRRFYRNMTGNKPNNSPSKNMNKDTQLQHTLLINTVRAIITRACFENPNLELVEWIRSGKNCTDKVIKKDGKSTTINPDGFFKIQDSDGNQSAYFLEADRTSMSNKKFVEKLEKYYAYYNDIRKEKRKQKLQRKGKKKLSNAFNIPGFRVLTVIEHHLDWQKYRSKDRLLDFIEAGLKASDDKGFMGFLFTKKSQLDMERPESIFEKIWHISHPEELGKLHSILD